MSSAAARSFQSPTRSILSCRRGAGCARAVSNSSSCAGIHIPLVELFSRLRVAVVLSFFCFGLLRPVFLWSVLSPFCGPVLFQSRLLPVVCASQPPVFEQPFSGSILTLLLRPAVPRAGVVKSGFGQRQGSTPADSPRDPCRADSPSDSPADSPASLSSIGNFNNFRAVSALRGRGASWNIYAFLPSNVSSKIVRSARSLRPRRFLERVTFFFFGPADSPAFLSSSNLFVNSLT